MLFQVTLLIFSVLGVDCACAVPPTGVSAYTYSYAPCFLLFNEVLVYARFKALLRGTGPAFLPEKLMLLLDFRQRNPRTEDLVFLFKSQYIKEILIIDSLIKIIILILIIKISR